MYIPGTYIYITYQVEIAVGRRCMPYIPTRVEIAFFRDQIATYDIYIPTSIASSSRELGYQVQDSFPATLSSKHCTRYHIAGIQKRNCHFILPLARGDMIDTAGGGASSMRPRCYY